MVDTSHEQPEMKITALAPWYGCKRTLAPVILEELGEHSFYVEPFCGSMAMLFAKAPASMEVVNDLHADLINLARVLASDRAADLYERVARVLSHEDLTLEVRELVRSPDFKPAPSIDEVGRVHVDRAFAFFVLSWQARNGWGGTKLSNLTTARRFTHNGGSNGLRWRSAVDSIPAWHERLRSVQILRMNAFDLLGRLGDQERTVIYADPPYLVKSDKYIHDLAEADHKRLAAALGRFKNARVIVSYYDHPRLESLYPGWTKRDVSVTKALVNQGKRDAEGEIVKAPEVLLINGPSLAYQSKLTNIRYITRPRKTRKTNLQRHEELLLGQTEKTPGSDD